MKLRGFSDPAVVVTEEAEHVVELEELAELDVDVEDEDDIEVEVEVDGVDDVLDTDELLLDEVGVVDVVGCVVP